MSTPAKDWFILGFFSVLVAAVVIDNVWQTAIISRLVFPLRMIATEAVLSKEERELRARDVQRVDDLKRIQAALEAYLRDHPRPPKPADYGEDNAWRPFDTSTEGDFMPFLVPNYLAEVPRDPLNIGHDPVERAYVYTYYAGDSGWSPNEAGHDFYVLGTYLENGQSNRFLDHEVGYWLGREFTAAEDE